MKKIFFLLSLLTCLINLHSQESSNKNQYVKKPAFGVHFTLSDFKTAQNIINQSLSSVILNKTVSKASQMSPGLALTYMKGLSNHVDLQGRLAGSFLDLPIPNKTAFNNDNFFGEADLSANLKMLSDKYYVSPFINLGIGAANYKGSYWSAFAPIGVGMQVNLWDEAFILLNSQYRIPIGGNNNYHFFHSIGIAGNIGKEVTNKVVANVPKIEMPVDSDGDGINDKDDACPQTFGIAKYKGCPIPDTDGDGINDEEDKCPSVPGVAKYLGCPIPDTDKDGINDEEDKCISLPGIAKYGGCPIPDTDGDGINDEEDKCPTVAGVASQQGCPEIKADVVKKMEYAAQHILFEINKSVLKPTSLKGLNDVAKILSENTDVKLNIDGYTDNSGIAEKNEVLSQNRANAVKTYLVSKGVTESRMTATGHGSNDPVADNATPVGRTKNRRVELKLNY